MDNNKVKQVAKIFAANILRNAILSGISTNLLHEYELVALRKELNKIADRVSPIHSSSLDDCISLVVSRKTITKP